MYIDLESEDPVYGVKTSKKGDLGSLSMPDSPEIQFWKVFYNVMEYDRKSSFFSLDEFYTNESWIKENVQSPAIMAPYNWPVDFCFEGTNNIILKASDYHDYIKTGNGHDVIHGGEGDDWIITQDGNDLVIGGDGNDIIFSGYGHDLISGGNGNDIIIMQGRGVKVAFGDLGADRFVITDVGGADSRHFIMDFELGNTEEVIFFDVPGINSFNDLECREFTQGTEFYWSEASSEHIVKVIGISVEEVFAHNKQFIFLS